MTTTRPILFSAPMIRALLDGSKTQTRRTVKHHPDTRIVHHEGLGEPVQIGGPDIKCSYGKPGDLLWVRETFAQVTAFPPSVRYYATDDVHELRKKRPAIYMPRWASRLTLELTDVRVEQLQDISEQDALAEGCGPVIADDLKTHPLAKHIGPAPVNHYAALWERINGETGPRSWDANPWVWALTFRVHQQNIDAYLNSRSEAA